MCQLGTGNGKHLAYLKDFGMIWTLAEKVRRRYGAAHPEMLEVENTFHSLSEDLLHHMHKEEQALFPSITGQQRAQRDAIPVLDIAHGFAMPIHVMEAEHQACEDLLRRLRILIKIFQPPPEACTTLRAFYQGLAQFDSDTREHFHVENDFLFPRALGRAASATQN